MILTALRLEITVQPIKAGENSQIETFVKNIKKENLDGKELQDSSDTW